MTAGQPKQKPRSRRIYVLWGLALALLLGLSVFCWLVGVPFLRARAMLESLPQKSLGDTEEVRRRGGTRRVVGCMRVYLRMPESIAPKRRTAARLLGFCGDAGVPELARMLGKWPDTRAGWEAAKALGRIRTAATVKPLVAVLEDPRAERHTCMYAALSLESVRDPEAVDELLAALKSQKARIRKAAVCALRGVQDRRAAGALLAALDDEDKLVRHAAVGAQQWIRDPRAVAPLIRELRNAGKTFPKGPDWHRGLVAISLFRIGKPAVDEVLKLLKDEDKWMRHWGAWILGSIGDSRAVEPLRAMESDDSEKVRKSAADALKRIKQARLEEAEKPPSTQ